MIRNAVRAATILLATLAIPAAIFAAPLPASAGSNHLCETYDPTTYCLGSANLDLYTSVYEANPGRNLIQTPLGTTFDHHPNYLLQFSADATKCVAVAGDLNTIEIRPCNGGTGIVWARVKDADNVFRWINRYATQNSGGTNLYLSGWGVGVIYQLRVWGQYGFYQRFSWQ